MNLTILFGGVSPEHEVSIASASYVSSSVKKYFSQKINLQCLYISKKNSVLDAEYSMKIIQFFQSMGKTIMVPEKLDQLLEQEDFHFHEFPIEELSSLIRKSDTIFPLIHGTYGEDGNLQGFSTLMGKRVIGFNTLNSAIGMDKIVFKHLCRSNNIKTAHFEWTSQKRISQENVLDIYNNIKIKLGVPFFMKAANQGSSIGVYKIHNQKEFFDSLDLLLKITDKILFEKFIRGIELEISFIEKSDNTPFVSKPGRVIPSDEFYTYEDKYIKDMTRFEIPAGLDEEIIERVREIARSIIGMLDASGYARIDFFYDEENDDIICNEINSIPGFTKISMFPQLLLASGMSEEEIFSNLLFPGISGKNSI